MSVECLRGNFTPVLLSWRANFPFPGCTSFLVEPREGHTKSHTPASRWRPQERSSPCRTTRREWVLLLSEIPAEKKDKRILRASNRGRINKNVVLNDIFIACCFGESRILRASNDVQFNWAWIDRAGIEQNKT